MRIFFSIRASSAAAAPSDDGTLPSEVATLRPVSLPSGALRCLTPSLRAGGNESCTLSTCAFGTGEGGAGALTAATGVAAASWSRGAGSGGDAGAAMDGGSAACAAAVDGADEIAFGPGTTGAGDETSCVSACHQSPMPASNTTMATPARSLVQEKETRWGGRDRISGGTEASPDKLARLVSRSCSIWLIRLIRLFSPQLPSRPARALGILHCHLHVARNHFLPAFTVGCQHGFVCKDVDETWRAQRRPVN